MGSIKKTTGALPPELLLGAIVESSDDAIISKTLEGTVTSWNKGAENLYGYRSDEIVGKSIGLLIPAERPNEMPGILQRIRSGEKIDHYHTVRVKKDGGRLDISLSVSPVRDSNGEIVGAATIARNISAEKDLERVRGHLAAIIDFSDDAIIGKTLDGTVTSWNRGAELLYGYRAHEIIGKSITTLVPEERPDEVPKILEKLKCGERIKHWTTVRVTKEGERKAISLTISPIKDSQGRIIGAATIARDVTQQIDAYKRQQEFISVASHELRTPITALRGYLEMLDSTMPKDLTDARRLSDRANIAAERLSDLLEDLLNIARLEEDRISLKILPHNPDRLVRDALETFGPALEVKELRCSYESSLPEGPVVRLDEARFNQIFINLLDNAIKYTLPGGEINIKAGVSGSDVVLRIQDTGIGINRENLERIFDKFFREEKVMTSEARGTGLGLYITRELVERQGGSLLITSEEGKGTLAELKFPLTSFANAGANNRTSDGTEKKRKPRRKTTRTKSRQT